MKKYRLFDFSIPAGLAALLVFPALLYFSFARYYYERLTIYLPIFILLLCGILYLIYRFVFRAATLDQEGLHFGRLTIPRERLLVVSEYDIRFRESIYLLRDSAADYSSLTDKEQKEKEVRVQATMGNTRKLSEYCRIALMPAQKPKRKK